MTPSTPNKPSKVPITLSAFVFPGAGQCMQQRWVAGSIYALFFGVCLLLLLINIFKPLIHNLRVAMELASTNSNEPFMLMPWGSILIPFSIGLLIYLASLIDTSRAYRRSMDAWRKMNRDNG